MNGSITEKDQVQAKIQEEVVKFLSEHKAWVSDGTYSKIQPIIVDEAEIVVLIKRPLFYRVISHIYRVLKGVERHPEVTRFSDLRFTKTLVKRWLKNEDVNLAEFTKQYKHKLVILRSFKEVDKYFDSLVFKI